MFAALIATPNALNDGGRGVGQNKLVGRRSFPAHAAKLDLWLARRQILYVNPEMFVSNRVLIDERIAIGA